MRGFGGDISTAPLTAQGSNVQRKWLEDYLLLPTGLDATDSRDLAAYLMSLSRPGAGQEGREG